MKKIVKIIIIIVLLLLMTMALIKTLSNEDDWICCGGQWVKHGNPSAEKPPEPCETTSAFNLMHIFKNN